MGTKKKDTQPMTLEEAFKALYPNTVRQVKNHSANKSVTEQDALDKGH